MWHAGGAARAVPAQVWTPSCATAFTAEYSKVCPFECAEDVPESAKACIRLRGLVRPGMPTRERRKLWLLFIC